MHVTFSICLNICMDDLLRVAEAKEAVASTRHRDKELTVSYKKESESCAILEATTDEEGGDTDATMGAEDSSAKGEDDSAVLLHQDMKKSQMQLMFPSVYLFLSSYRSSNPDKRVTPFAIVLLVVLFLVYVLNQADRLVLAVTIPAGLRCELKASECAANGSINSSLAVAAMSDDVRDYSYESNGNSSNTSSQDCIHFSDSQQGLLTGELVLL